MAKVELKQPVVDAIAEEIKDAQSVVLVDYRGLTVAQDTELRKQLREAGIVYKVYKNTMMKRAFEGTEFAGLDDCLKGPSAIAISKDDATAPARIICNFAKTADKRALPAIPMGRQAGTERRRSRGQCIRCRRTDRAVQDSVKRSSSFQTAWKHAVTDHELRTCHQADC